MASIRDVGLAEGRIFDQATLDRADQELRRQYLARGYYGVKIKTTATPLERHRVRITINVDEGRASSISSIRFNGNRLFESEELLDQMQLGMPNWFSWYTKRDLYSREKLAALLRFLRFALTAIASLNLKNSWIRCSWVCLTGLAGTQSVTSIAVKS